VKELLATTTALIWAGIPTLDSASAPTKVGEMKKYLLN
jgi:hypothetical protein